MLYNQRKKLYKDTLFSATVKRNFKIKAISVRVSSFSHFTMLKFEQRRLLRECIEPDLLKTQYALVYRKSLSLLTWIEV